MKVIIAACLTVFAALSFISCGQEGNPVANERPNIIIIRLTQMYNCARCCPTRASLMTGKYQHRVGMALNGRTLSLYAPTLAEILSENGYHTGMAGKWHLSRTQALEPETDQLKWMAHQADYGDFAPLETYPCNRGFDEHWGVIWGS
jgi:arylsulfatase A-like enzyme